MQLVVVAMPFFRTRSWTFLDKYVVVFSAISHHLLTTSSIFSHHKWGTVYYLINLKNIKKNVFLFWKWAESRRLKADELCNSLLFVSSTQHLCVDTKRFTSFNLLKSNFPLLKSLGGWVVDNKGKNLLYRGYSKSWLINCIETRP